MISWLITSWLIYIVHAAFVVGLVGTFFSYVLYRIPFVWKYATAIKLVALPLLVVSIFFEGYFFASKSWMEETKKYQEQVKVAEEQAKIANETVKEVVVEKIKYVTEQKVIIKEKIKEVEVSIDSQCKIVPEVVSILNEAAKTPVKGDKK
jgi:hypothetical protein